MQKRALLPPDSISNDVTHLDARILDILSGKVTVHGPIRVKFWLGDKGNRVHYRASFYVLPRSYGVVVLTSKSRAWAWWAGRASFWVGPELAYLMRTTAIEKAASARC